MNELDTIRLREIIKIAVDLKWVHPKLATDYYPSYPLMELSEVEKCMLAMVDDIELARLRKWQIQTRGTVLT